MTDEEWRIYQQTSDEWETIIERLVPDWSKMSEKNKVQIDAAVTLIDPKSDLKAKCCEEVARTLISISLHSYLRRGIIARQTKEGKAALVLLAKGFFLVEATLRNKALDPSLKEDILTYFQPMGPTELKDLATDLSEMGAAKTGRGTHTGEKTKAKQFAIQNARRLLNMFSKKPEIANDAKKGSKFCNLAAILFGEDNKNLSQQCQKYLDDMEQFHWLPGWRSYRKSTATPKK